MNTTGDFVSFSAIAVHCKLLRLNYLRNQEPFGTNSPDVDILTFLKIFIITILQEEITIRSREAFAHAETWTEFNQTGNIIFKSQKFSDFKSAPNQNNYYRLSLSSLMVRTIANNYKILGTAVFAFGQLSPWSIR